MAYSYKRTHIPDLTPEMVRAKIDNPTSTYQDLDSLSFAVMNKFGMASPLLDEISFAISVLQHCERAMIEDQFEEAFIQPTYILTE